MADVIGANEINSKIFWCEVYIVISSLTTIILSIIDVNNLFINGYLV